ncbi:hypothetical protein AJ79_06560 [Helicocarpus griseus UAMH5409]|uniref:Regulator of phospholipase D SRF1 n=1 Tax=Helicocarpus griseus UAMH5409 TaxID=1447875 RepID=A0A2B7XCC7_9EURO|nr:hypothetical protein AJ79_06560 [Helicocarpus griseus UAMH5409]
MAVYGDSLLRPQPPDAQSGGSPKRKSELSLVDHPLVRRKSGNSSVAASSVNNDEDRSGVRQSQDQNSNLSNSRAPSRGISITTQSPGRAHSARTVPAWVRLSDDSNDPRRQSHSAPPQPARIAQHNFAPHERDRESFSAQGLPEIEGRDSRWKTFARSTAYPRLTELQEKLVDHEWLNRNMGDYAEPWQGHFSDKDLESGQKSFNSRQRKRRFFARAQSKILKSPMVPLIIRLTVFIFCAVALSLGGSIRHFSSKFNHPQGPSTDMAIVVDAVALVYLVYITYDEYTGKPLGLRPAKAKMRLIFLDLIFIVFASANLSLAFESLSDVQGACTAGEVNRKFDPRNDIICDRQKALASVLLIVLIAWITTFAISVLRYVDYSCPFSVVLLFCI